MDFEYPGILKAVPNVLSGLRLSLVVILWIFAFTGLPALVGLGVIFASATDVLDGFLARKLRRVTEFGSKLDSLADNMLLLSVLPWILMLRPEIVRDHPGLVLVGTLTYFSSILVGWWKFKTFAPNLHVYSARVSSIVGSIFIIHAFFFNYNQTLFYMAIGMFILSSAETFLLYLKKPTTEGKVGSILLASQKRNLA